MDDEQRAPESPPDATAPPPPLNREQRRARRFGHHHDAPQDNLQPQSRNNPAFGVEDDDAAYAGRPDQGVQHDVGAGSGGATESDGRVTRHEGVHLGNQPNS